MLDANKTALVLIDMQKSLWQAMPEKERLLDNARRLLEGCKALGVPVLWTEQIPEKLGPTLVTLGEVLAGYAAPTTKSSFSCCGAEEFMRQLQASGRRQLLLCGVETHVCVHQTALDLLAAGHEVHLAADAVASRNATNHAIALQRMQQAGAQLTSVEMALFEMLRDARHPKFRDILKLVK